MQSRRVYGGIAVLQHSLGITESKHSNPILLYRTYRGAHFKGPGRKSELLMRQATVSDTVGGGEDIPPTDSRKLYRPLAE
ncbi:hypothetical protein CDAR_186821 [Caerostris darwini]|uniref:Uncharacterized protein n=1 Tax=Caerostris darwini TaxID=1538125 RepID=A0AAV4PL79_9ARAC|nr:hypothetical protein CDAR_186821 [Caerostris darwini]